MFAETFFLALTLWREQPSPEPRASLWHRDPDGIERRFVVGRARAPEAVRRLRPRRLRAPTVPLTVRAA